MKRLFHDPSILRLAELMGCPLDMADGADFSCLYLGDGCDYRAGTLCEVRIHLSKYAKQTRIYLEFFEVFWEPVICSYVKNNRCSTVGVILNSRLPNVLPRMHPLDYEDAIRYWTRSTEDEDENADEFRVKRQARDQKGQERVNMQARDQEDQVKVNQDQEAGNEDQEEPRRAKKSQEEPRRAKKKANYSSPKKKKKKKKKKKIEELGGP
jgi:hypothetical protein